PGMTATVEFVIDRAEDVLKVPNSALRFQPTAEMLAAAGGPSAGAGTAPTGTRARPDGGVALWYVDAAGRVSALPVRTGLTDGQSTVVEGEGLEEGMEVIAAVVGAGGPSGATAVNPFQAQQRQGGPPPRF